MLPPLIKIKLKLDKISYHFNNFGEKMRELVSFDWALKNILREKANFYLLSS
jgi:hypothetical protein